MQELIKKMEGFLKKQIQRKQFIKIIISGIFYFLMQNKFLRIVFAKQPESKGRLPKKINAPFDLVLANGQDPYKNTVLAIEKLGGMSLFVKKGSTVVVKPNMAWNRTPEQAANTEPQVVAAIVELCYKAGAKRVNVFDISCNDDRLVYAKSGIEKAAKDKGAHVYFADHWNVVKAKFPYKSSMEGWPVLRDAIECDTFINVPVLKSHGLTKLTLSMKNLMGVCSGTRGFIHLDIASKLVDITDFIKPELTVIDATRFLSKHGPNGGKPEDVITLNKIIASTDPTLADIFACSLVNMDPMDIPYIKEAISRNFGITNISAANIAYV